jgi:hypothetical protein
VLSGAIGMIADEARRPSARCRRRPASAAPRHRTEVVQSAGEGQEWPHVHPMAKRTVWWRAVTIEFYPNGYPYGGQAGGERAVTAPDGTYSLADCPCPELGGLFVLPPTAGTGRTTATSATSWGPPRAASLPGADQRRDSARQRWCAARCRASTSSPKSASGSRHTEWAWLAPRWVLSHSTSRRGAWSR